jgi:hypothetical protein
VSAPFSRLPATIANLSAWSGIWAPTIVGGQTTGGTWTLTGRGTVPNPTGPGTNSNAGTSPAKIWDPAIPTTTTVTVRVGGALTLRGPGSNIGTSAAPAKQVSAGSRSPSPCGPPSVNAQSFATLPPPKVPAVNATAVYDVWTRPVRFSMSARRCRPAPESPRLSPCVSSRFSR